MRVSLKDISAEAGGISVAAVSLALRGSPEVSEATRLRVRNIAERLGYRPRPEISHLASRRWKNRGDGGMKVAFITHRSSLHQGARLPQVIKETASLRGFDAEPFVIEDYPDGTAMGEVLWTRGIEALLVGPVFDRAFVQVFPWERFSGVSVETGYYAPDYDRVVPDLLGCIRDAWARVVERGKRRIGLAWIMEPVEPLDGWEKEAGFLLCRQKGIGIGVETVQATFALPLDTPTFSGWIKQNRLEAVIGQTPVFYYPLRNLRSRPRIGFVSLISNPIEKDVSGYIMAHDRLMARAWQDLDWQLRNFQRGIPEVVMQNRISLPWNEGATLSLPKPVAGKHSPRRSTPGAAAHRPAPSPAAGLSPPPVDATAARGP